jgi:Flp pilus assembly protein TadB
VLKQPLTDPKVKKITLHFPLGLEVVARNMKGVTIKDALDAIHKQMKKRVRVPSSCDSLLVSSSSHFASS